MLGLDESLDLTRLRARYRAGTLRPSEVVASVLERIDRRGDDKVWIHLLPRREILERAQALDRESPNRLALFGIPFAIKDNIDLAGHPTTAACPDYAYTPRVSAPVVRKLIDAGAIAIGKTNLDQFATGLVGTRSPYGTPGNPFNPHYIPGGSSSGSAVAVAAGLVSFALGTDTAGSGRVPAAFNNIVGLKPTRGLLSSGGVVPACRSLDCVSIFGLTSADVGDVLDVARGFDPADPFSRPGPETTHEWADGEKRSFRFGVPAPEQLEFFGNDDGRGLFEVSLRKLEELGGVRVAVNLRPFLEAAHLLYNGPWLAERYAAIRDFIDRQPEALHPVTRQVIQGGATPSAADAFTGYYRLKELKRETASVWSAIDVLVTPTAGTMYSIGEVDREPIRLNSNLGYYTNFVNLLDLCALAIPGGFQSNSLPFGTTLVAPAFQDAKLVVLGDALQRRIGLKLGATSCTLPDPQNHAEMASREGARTSHVVRLAVCGAHMSGLPLNHQLTQRQSRLLRACRTAPHYRLYALENCQALRPGLIRSEPGHAIEVEVWAVPVEHFGSFVDAIPSPLGIGTVELEDGEQVRGFLCETYAIANARDISELGGWRAYLAARQS